MTKSTLSAKIRRAHDDITYHVLGKGKTATLSSTLKSIEALHLRNAGPAPAHDGYPTSTPGAAPRAGGGGIADDVKLTTVESAVDAMSRKGERDDIGRWAAEAEVLALRMAKDHARLASIAHKFERIDDTSSIADPSSTAEEQCYLARHYGLQPDPEWAVIGSSTLGGYYSEPRPVCAYVRRFVTNRRSQPDAYKSGPTVPTREDMLRHLTMKAV